MTLSGKAVTVKLSMSCQRSAKNKLQKIIFRRLILLASWALAFYVTKSFSWSTLLWIYTVSQKTSDYIFYNNFNNKCPITIIFGIVSS